MVSATEISDNERHRWDCSKPTRWLCAGEGNGKALLNLYQERPMKKRTKINRNTVLEDETHRLEGTQRATGEELRIKTSNSVSCDATGSRPIRSSVGDGYRRERKVQCCKKTHTVGTWNLRNMIKAS